MLVVCVDVLVEILGLLFLPGCGGAGVYEISVLVGTAIIKCYG